MKTYNGKEVSTLTVGEAEKIVKETAGRFAGIIYCYTNTVNGKKYVGQTRRPKDRHYSHIKNEYHINDLTPLHHAIAKYGADSFRYEILELFIAGSIEELRELLNEAERHYIKELQSRVSEFGYNVALGGQFNQESGPKTWGSRPVDMFTLEGHFIRSFNSVSDAQCFVGLAGPGIRDVCNHIKYTAAGYLWAWAGELPAIPVNKNEVSQYDLDGNYVATYRTASEASLAVGCSSITALSHALKDKHRIGKGFYWRRYKADRIPLTDFPKAIFSYDKTGKFLKGYITLQDAVDDVKASGASAICGAISRNNLYRDRLWRRFYVDHLDYEDVPKFGVRVKVTYPDESVKVYLSIKAVALDNQWELSGVKSAMKGKNVEALRHVVVERYEGSIDPSEHPDWVFVQENEITHKELYHPGKLNVQVDQYDKAGKFLKTFSSVSEAEHALGLTNVSSAIRCQECCGGFIWTRHGEQLPRKVLERIESLKVYQYDWEGRFVAEHENKEAAALAIGYTSSNSHIGRCIREPWRKAKGYYWRDIRSEKIDVTNLKRDNGKRT